MYAGALFCFDGAVGTIDFNRIYTVFGGRLRAYMFMDFFVGGELADDPRFASKACDKRIFCMSYSVKCPLLAIWLGGGRTSM